MKFFAELGMRIDDAWKSVDYDEAKFPDIAARCLEETRPSDHVDMLGIIEWVHTTRELNRTVGYERQFGQPPVTIYSTPRFYIEVLFWMDSTTTIHQHGFCGAFHVLDGGSIHSQYSFERTKRYNDHLYLGDLKLQGIEHLEKGAIRRIESGHGTIHALFHLEHPSISVVVRTPHADVGEPQYSYMTAGVAFDPFYTNEAIYLRRRTLSLLRDLDHPSFKMMAVRAVRDSDALDATLLLQHLALIAKTPGEFGDILDDVLPRHAELIEKARTMEKAFRRESNITSRRASIKGKEHRFFLALLLNVRSRTEILRLVGEAYPGMSPVDRIVSWTKELSTATVRDAASGETASLIGFELNEVSLIVFRLLLSGASNDEALGRLCDELGETDVEELRPEVTGLCTAFRTSLLFGTMLSS